MTPDETKQAARVPKPAFNVGDQVMVRCDEHPAIPFPAIVSGVWWCSKYRQHEYRVMENDGLESDGYTAAWLTHHITTNSEKCIWGGETRKGPCGLPAVCITTTAGSEPYPTCEKHRKIAEAENWQIAPIPQNATDHPRRDGDGIPKGAQSASDASDCSGLID